MNKWEGKFLPYSEIPTNESRENDGMRKISICKTS